MYDPSEIMGKLNDCLLEIDDAKLCWLMYYDKNTKRIKVQISASKEDEDEESLVIL